MNEEPATMCYLSERTLTAVVEKSPFTNATLKWWAEEYEARGLEMPAMVPIPYRVPIIGR